MEKFTIHAGTVALLDRADVDTDQIIPKQFLKKIERSGFGKHLFHDWRFLDDDGQKENPDFALNQERYRGATILIARDNFGCGSSREHAPWALLDYGFRVIIAPSFADIFFNNCFKNGILPVMLDADSVQQLFNFIESRPGQQLDVDLEKKTVAARDKGEVLEFSFEVDSFRRECLLNGWDDIGLTMRHEKEIEEFEKRYRQKFDFLFAAL